MNPKTSEIEANKEYTFSVQGYNGTGLWKMDGFECLSNDRTNTEIIVKGKDSIDKAVISYTPEDTKYPKQSLTLNYKKNE